MFFKVMYFKKFKFMVYLSMAVVALFSFGFAKADDSPDFILPGTATVLTTDTIWTLDKSPYILTDDVVVPDGVTLTIEPGVVVESDPNSSAINISIISGVLNAAGIKDNKITFRGIDVAVSGSGKLNIQYLDDFSNSSSPFTVVSGGSISILDSTIDGGYVGVSVGEGASLVMDRSIIKNTIDYGISSYSAGEPNIITVHNSSIFSKGSGISLSGNEKLNFHYNSIYDGSTWSAFSDNKYGQSDLSLNWWGSADCPITNTGTDHSAPFHSVEIGVSVIPCLNFDPVVNPGPDPVIIIPGIMGTKILDGASTQKEIWPDLGDIITSFSDQFLNILSLNPDGTPSSQNPVELGDIIRSVSPPVGPTSHVFDNLISKLIDSGYQENANLFVFPYDWRISDADNAVILKNKIDDILQKIDRPKINIIAHSMGGLIAQKYVADTAGVNLDKLIFIGTPHLGSPKAFKTLMYGDDMGMRYGPLSLLNSSVIKQISQNMPSVYDLMPSRQYVDGSVPTKYVFDNAGKSPLDYDQTASLMSDAGRNTSLFAQAESLHSQIDSQSFGNVHVYNFVGCGAGKTIGSFILKNKNKPDDFQLRYVNGDETVPAFSATVPYGVNYYVKNFSHMELPSASGVPENILSILQSGRASSENFSNISNHGDSCFIGGTVVSKHSPVRMDIYDALGNHTGPKGDNGDIEYGIDGVSYDEVGTDAFAFLPDGGDYRVVNTPTDIGTYDFYVQKIAPDDTVQDEQVWSDVPIKTLQDSSEFDIKNNAVMTVSGIESPHKKRRGVYVDVGSSETSDPVVESLFVVEPSTVVVQPVEVPVKITAPEKPDEKVSPVKNVVVQKITIKKSVVKKSTPKNTTPIVKHVDSTPELGFWDRLQAYLREAFKNINIWI